MWRITKSQKRHIVWLLQVANGLVFTNVNTIGPWKAASMPHLEPPHKKWKQPLTAFYFDVFMLLDFKCLKCFFHIQITVVIFHVFDAYFNYQHIHLLWSPALPNKTYQRHNMDNASEIHPAYSRTSLNETFFHSCTRLRDTMIMLIQAVFRSYIP